MGFRVTALYYSGLIFPSQLYVVSSVHGALPFSLEDASRAEADQEKEDPRFNKVQLDTRLNNRVLELRVSQFTH